MCSKLACFMADNAAREMSEKLHTKGIEVEGMLQIFQQIRSDPRAVIQMLPKGDLHILNTIDQPLLAKILMHVGSNLVKLDPSEISSFLAERFTP